MLWKERYRIGVDLIDRQHEELFHRVQRLLEAIDGQEGVEVYQETIAFLKEYVLLHFRDEEAYQEKIGYALREVHKKAHRNFTALVLDYEEKLLRSNFDVALVKDLAGTLLSWLIYHVTNDDMKIVQNEQEEQSEQGLSYVSLLTGSVLETLSSMAGLDTAQIKSSEAVGTVMSSNLQVQIGLFGDVNGVFTQEYTEDFVLSLMEYMLMERPEQLDELSCSAMAEIANISLGNATIKLSGRGVACDIKPPSVSVAAVERNGGGLVIETDIGAFRLSAELDQY